MRSTGDKKRISGMRRKLAVGALGVVAASSLGGAAFASSAHRATTKTTTHRHRILLGADHASLEVKRAGTWVTIDFDRGTVTAVSATSITLARPDGQSVTEAISSTTRFRGVADEAALKVGRSARVFSENGTALRIAQRRAVAGASTTA